MTKLRRSVVLVLVSAATARAAAQAPPACAELGTSMRNVSTSRAGDTVSVYACAFDRQTVTQTCTVNTTLATGPSMHQTTAQTWASVADLVDQYKVIPPLNYSQRLVTGGDGPARTTTYAYDARRRVVREDVVTAGAKTALMWSEWDANGRPTKGKWSGDPAPYFDMDTIRYDDGGRILHREITGAGATTQDIEYDPQGRSVKTTARSSAGQVVSMMKVLASEKVCR